MQPRNRSTRNARCLASAALALLLATGCATTPNADDQQERAKLAKSHFDLGIDHLDNGRFAVGLRELRLAETYDPKDPRIQVALAEAYMHRGKAAEAEKHLLRALEIYPDFHDARLNLAGLYLMLGRFAEAAAQCRILIDDPTFPGIWRAFTNLAVAEMRLGERVEARRNLDMALEFQPDYWPALPSRTSTGSARRRRSRARARRPTTTWAWRTSHWGIASRRSPISRWRWWRPRKANGARNPRRT